MIFIDDTFRQRFDAIGFTPEKIFTDPAIKPWRNLPDRQNCTWDLPDGTRLHIKRYPKLRGLSPARLEATGYDLLRSRHIPTANVAAYGELSDGRSFIAIEDLAGFSPADKLIAAGFPFARLLIPTANLAAALHGAQLHHRDLYLCHFMVRPDDGNGFDLRLIDAARVRPLPGPLTRRRWIVKDLAQFWYSTLSLPITDPQRVDWLQHYARAAGIADVPSLQKSIQKKSTAIATHDARLRRRQPLRNISIPTE